MEEATSDELNIRRHPNEGLYKGIKNGLMLGLISGLITLPFNIMLRIMIRRQDVFDLSVLAGGALWMMICISFVFGGIPYIKHFILRALLMYNRFAPFGYEKFLDYASSLIFLRKVGGGYEFVHSRILDYFASLEPPG